MVDVLDKEKILSLNDLKNNNDKRIEIDEGEFIEISLRPSNHGTQANTLSYIIKGVGIPIEVRINQKLEYEKFIVKSRELMKGYVEFAKDSFGNLVQDKAIYPPDVNGMRGELRVLRTEYNNS